MSPDSLLMKLYRTREGAVLETTQGRALLSDDWDALMRIGDLRNYLEFQVGKLEFQAVNPSHSQSFQPLAPVVSQEVWAAGVTYLRSRSARVEESKDAGGSSFYDRVYDAQRPELFFKAAGSKVRGPGDEVRIRRDARWSVPEPEIALCVNAHGRIVGHTIGNDMSSRDIEGENPLYLPQAKIYDGSCALGPALLVGETLPSTTTIGIRIERGGVPQFEGETSWSRMRRTPQELVDWLYRENTFPNGCVLLTGTGVVPPDEFTLEAGDVITIQVAEIGTLTNTVAAS